MSTVHRRQLLIGSHLYPHPPMVEVRRAVREILVRFGWLVNAGRFVVFLGLCQQWLIQHTTAIFVNTQKRHPKRSQILWAGWESLCFDHFNADRNSLNRRTQRQSRKSLALHGFAATQPGQGSVPSHPGTLVPMEARAN